MENEELFHKTIKVLSHAYLNGTLEHSNCYACAVGNMVAAALGKKFVVRRNDLGQTVHRWTRGKASWHKVFCSTLFGQVVRSYEYEDEAKYELDATGYRWQDLARIEEAFETVYLCHPLEFNSDDHQYRGLMAVVDVLMDIHKADEKTIKEAKLLFVR